MDAFANMIEKVQDLPYSKRYESFFIDYSLIPLLMQVRRLNSHGIDVNAAILRAAALPPLARTSPVCGGFEQFGLFTLQLHHQHLTSRAVLLHSQQLTHPARPVTHPVPLA